MGRFAGVLRCRQYLVTKAPQLSVAVAGSNRGTEFAFRRSAENSLRGNRTTGDRFFFTSQSSFDPLKAPSATILKQVNADLSPEELALKNSLQNYQDGKDDESSLSQCLEDLQKAYMDLEYWEEALKVEERKCDLYFKEGTDDYADSIHAQGKLCLRQDDFNNSRRLYEQALEYFSSAQNDVQRGHVMISLAGWHYFQDDLNQALEYLQESELLLDSNPSLLVKCLDNQGLIYRLWGEFDTALEKYRQGLQVVVEDETRLALNMHVADMLVALEDQDQALELYQELLLETRTSNPGMHGVLLHNIASIHVDQGDYELALNEFQQALQIKIETGGEHNLEVAKTWTSLGKLQASVFDEKALAIQCFKEVLLIARIHSEDPKTDPNVLAAIQNITILEQELDNEE